MDILLKNNEKEEILHVGPDTRLYQDERSQFHFFVLILALFLLDNVDHSLYIHFFYQDCHPD